MTKGLQYHPFLMDFLKDPIISAAYIDVFFDETDPEPELLKVVLYHVAEALCQEKMTPEEAKEHLVKLDELLSKKGNDAIYDLGIWLKVLGLKLTVTVDKQPQECLDNSPQPEDFFV
ncbi:MAG: DNA-binding protein [Microcoleaceae cyanobacterium]